MTEDYIAAIVGKDRVLAGHPIVCPNVNHLFRGQQDVISVNKRGVVIEYEIKISRADFKRDARKNKDLTFQSVHKVPQYIPNQFYYVVPLDMITVEELPWYAGLFYVINGKLELQKTAPVLSTHKHDLSKIYAKVATLYQQRHFLGSCLLTFKNKEGRS